MASETAVPAELMGESRVCISKNCFRKTSVFSEVQSVLHASRRSYQLTKNIAKMKGSQRHSVIERMSRSLESFWCSVTPEVQHCLFRNYSIEYNDETENCVCLETTWWLSQRLSPGNQEGRDDEGYTISVTLCDSKSRLGKNQYLKC